MDTGERESISVIRNIVNLMIADMQEELERSHSDEAESEVETIEILLAKARGVLKELESLLS